MNIAGREIGPGQPPYIIAEVSCNHGGILNRAKELILAAKACGADAVKFQAYAADTMTIDCLREEFLIKDGPWAGWDMHALYTRTETPFDWFPEIKLYAETVGIAWFASVFDNSAVDLMYVLGAPALKIASFEIVDLPLIRYATRTGLPLIISTGMASDKDIGAACAAAWHGQDSQTALLHRVSGYPAQANEANLEQLRWLSAQHFKDAVGISDHTTGPEIPIAATALGANVIEKHFRLSWHPDTEDSPFSLNETEFYRMVAQVKNTWAAMQPAAADAEAASRRLRRSLFAVADIKAGEKFTEANVRSIRPGHGLPPAAISVIIGKTAARDIERGEPMAWEMVRQVQV